MIDKNTTNEEVKSWVKNSVTLKLIIVVVLMLLLMIPTAMIKDIIKERQSLKQEAISEVSNKWAEKQQINGPLLTIPLVYEEVVMEYGDSTITEETRYLHILPEHLRFDGSVSPETRKRGIYEVVVYDSDLKVNGTFKLNQEIDREGLKEIRYDQAFLTIGISDMKGIKEKLNMNWNGQRAKVLPGSKIPNVIGSGITVKLPSIADSTGGTVPFSFQLGLKGSENLSFVPLGSNTTVNLTSIWPSPSFNGNYIPIKHDVSKEGFSAQWKVLELNRNVPKYWVGNSKPFAPEENAFGVDLMLTMDDYQKSMRSAKYAVMTISLTFLVFFLVEVINKTKIHPFQYALVGLALSLFYILLISISEHSNFNLAYMISSVGIILMISLYSISIFKMKKLSALLTFILTAIYAFLFITLQLKEYALLMGSVGLTLILAAAMYFTRNINWYRTSLSKS